MRIRFVMLVVSVVLALAAAPAIAAKGGKGKGGGKSSGSTINLVMVSDADGDGLPNHGDQVTFDVATTATDTPRVSLECHQAGEMVYSSHTGYYDSYPWPWTQTMTLASGAWTAGEADCTATLYRVRRNKTVTLATLSFDVGA